jgi:hypothetical protein
MMLALIAQRRLTIGLAAFTLIAGTLAWGPISGLWLAAWVIGLVCLGVGALIQEIAIHRNQQRPNSEPEQTIGEARRVKISGVGYLSVGFVVGGFPTILTVALLVAILADFLADHQLAKSFSL